jgi:hypothetical protein
MVREAINLTEVISLRSSLLIELLINSRSCHEAGSGSFAATAKVRGKRVDLVDIGGIAGLLKQSTVSAPLHQ